MLGVDNEEDGLAFGQVIVGHSIFLDDPSLPSPSYFVPAENDISYDQKDQDMVGDAANDTLGLDNGPLNGSMDPPKFFLQHSGSDDDSDEDNGPNTTQTHSLNFWMISLKLFQHSFFITTY